MSDNTFLLVIGEAECALWGLDNAERLRRAFARYRVPSIQSLDEAPPQSEIVLVRRDAVIEEKLIGDLLMSHDVFLSTMSDRQGGRQLLAIKTNASAAEKLAKSLYPGGYVLEVERIEDLKVESPQEMGSAYNEMLRKRADPYALRLTKENLGKIEKITFMASYKGATDFVTKYVWPWPARHLTKWAAAAHISPNLITTVSLLFVLLAMWLFWEGHLLLGCLAGWAMCLLDTVDGKLARVTLTSSKWGNVYDHGIDLVHPPFWYWAFWVGMGASYPSYMAPAIEVSLWIIVIGYVLGRVLEGLFLHGFKIQTHIWRQIDSQFREFTARRNPNLFILTVFVILGLPAAGFMLVAIWTVLSLLFHAIRLVQAAIIETRGGEIRSWMIDGK